jgi:hypothetical protein
MTIAEVRTQLVDKLENELRTDSFVWRKGKQFFSRTDDTRTQIIDLLFTKKGTTIQIEPTLRVKIKEVEDYYKPYFTRDIEYFESVKTIGNNLFKIKKYYDQGLTTDPDEHSYYLVENLNDIIPTATGLLNLIRDYGYQYFNQTADIAMVDRLLNSNPREISIHYSLYPMRAIIGTIAAYKAKNPNLTTLIETYREELVDAETQYKKEFEDIIREM